MAVLKSLKKFVKNFIMLRYTADGQVELLLRTPVRANTRKWYWNTFKDAPIEEKKVVFDNYMGKGFGCNAKYVALKLLEKYPGKLDLVWVMSEGESGHFPEGIRTVSYSSKEAKREYATAKVWVSNYHKIAYVKRGMYRRDGQYFLQMWHGSLGIKKIENDVDVLTKEANWLCFAKQSSCMVTHWISNSDFESNIYRKAFWGVEDSMIRLYGHPRNDLLLTGTQAARDKVADFFGTGDAKILFYAPTFREDYRLDCYQIDYEAMCAHLKEKLGGDWVVLIRMHPRVRDAAAKLIPDVDYIHDATRYEDIQELLAAADCMITDYSSCIFDFMLTRRPAFVFATDLEEYDTERGFYYPLSSTPFPIARNNEELLANVDRFDEEAYRAEVETFLEGKGCMEDGRASERVADLVAELTGII